MAGPRRTQQILRRLASEIAIVESFSVAWKNNLGPGLFREMWTHRVLPRPRRPKEFICNPSRGDMKDNGVPRQRMIENEVAHRRRGVPFVIEVVVVNEESSLQAEKQDY